MSDQPATLDAAIAALGLALKVEFVPFSKSRNSKEKRKSLNWRVTLLCKGREVLTTDYSAGIAHCPAYKASMLRGPNCNMRAAAAIAWECENGKASRTLAGHITGTKPLLPETRDVIASLAIDSRVLDFPTYEDFAADFGYDADSRKGESIYRQCLEIALKLRAGLGEQGLTQLQNATQDY